MPNDGLTKPTFWVIDGAGSPPRVRAVVVVITDDNDASWVWNNEQLHALAKSNPVYVYMGRNSAVTDAGVAELAGIPTIERVCLDLNQANSLG
jgi:hypothetical protein